MSDNELLMQTLADLRASIAALNIRLDNMGDLGRDQARMIARLEERTDRNTLGMIGSILGAGAVVIIQVLDWIRGH